MYNSYKTADNILHFIQSKGLTAKRLSEMIEYSSNRSLIADIRTGKIKKIDTFCYIAHALGVSLDDIVDNTKPYELK